jgi:hypothetical protein
MSQLKTIGLSLAVVGLGGSLLGLMSFGKRRKLTVADIDAMDDATFRQHITNIGLASQVQDALARLDRAAR